jgi:hypothetical protein
MPDTPIHVEPERIDDLPLALGLLQLNITCVCAFWSCSANVVQ